VELRAEQQKSPQIAKNLKECQVLEEMVRNMSKYACGFISEKGL
jgi:hypothetical protein